MHGSGSRPLGLRIAWGERVGVHVHNTVLVVLPAASPRSALISKIYLTRKPPASKLSSIPPHLPQSKITAAGGWCMYILKCHVRRRKPQLMEALSRDVSLSFGTGDRREKDTRRRGENGWGGRPMPACCCCFCCCMASSTSCYWPQESLSFNSSHCGASVYRYMPSRTHRTANVSVSHSG